MATSFADLLKNVNCKSCLTLASLTNTYDTLF